MLKINNYELKLHSFKITYLHIISRKTFYLWDEFHITPTPTPANYKSKNYNTVNIRIFWVTIYFSLKLGCLHVTQYNTSHIGNPITVISSRFMAHRHN